MEDASKRKDKEISDLIQKSNASISEYETKMQAKEDEIAELQSRLSRGTSNYAWNAISHDAIIFSRSISTEDIASWSGVCC